MEVVVAHPEVAAGGRCRVGRNHIRYGRRRGNFSASAEETLDHHVKLGVTTSSTTQVTPETYRRTLRWWSLLLHLRRSSINILAGGRNLPPEILAPSDLPPPEGSGF